MTDRISHVTVVLSENIRDDDVEPILNALRMTKGVADVRPHVSNVSETIASVRRDQQWCESLVALMQSMRA